MLICQGLIWGVFESRCVSMRLKQSNHTMVNVILEYIEKNRTFSPP